MRGRVWLDRLIVLLILLAAWQGGSRWLGSYWLSSPWAVARVVTSLLGGELIFHASYTINEAIGTVIGGLPAVLLPFLLRRQPIVVAILDPFMVGGYGAPKLAFAPLFILWFGIGIESKIALVAAVVFFIVYFSTLSGVRALEPKLVQMAQVIGAERTPGRPPHRVSRRGAGDLCGFPHRAALRHRRRCDRRVDLVQSGAGLSSADRRHELRHHAACSLQFSRRRSSCTASSPSSMSANASCCAGGRAARR